MNQHGFLRLSWCLAGAMLFNNRVASGQVPAVSLIPDEPSCSTCKVTAVPRVRMDVAAVDAGIPKVVREGGHGRYWILSGFEPPMVFDANGKFIRRVGRPGSGPGEFQTPQDLLALPGDSVLVVENGVAQVLDSGLRVTRRITMGRSLYPGVILRWPSTLVMAGDVMGPHLGRRRTHLVSLAGSEAEVVRQLENDDNVPRTSIPSAGVQQIAPAGKSGGVWSAFPFSYRLYLWTEKGGVERILERRPDWFSSPSEFWLGNASTPPPPRIARIQEDDAGRLWVFLLVAAPTWKEAWARAPRGARDVQASSVDLTRLFRTVVEVIDPAQARLIATAQFSDILVDVLPNNRAAFYGEDTTGEPRLYIATFAISR